MCPTGTTAQRLSATDSSLRSAFHVIDADRDGRISQNDLRQFYAAAAVGGGGDDVIEAMMQAADSNRNGYVEYDEFERVVEERENGRREKGGVMEEVFRAMDRDGDGLVGQEDLKGFFKRVGFAAKDEDIKAMIKLGEIGGDGSKGVSFDGFMNILEL